MIEDVTHIGPSGGEFRGRGGDFRGKDEEEREEQWAQQVCTEGNWLGRLSMTHLVKCAPLQQLLVQSHFRLFQS
jgi:hypothetical protein